MPVFFDCHPLTTVPSATLDFIHVEGVQGLIDRSGTQPLGNWVENEVIYCVVYAPDEQAVCQHHADRGLRCEDLHRLDEVRCRWPISSSDRHIVRAAIAGLWPPNGHRDIGRRDAAGAE